MRVGAHPHRHDDLFERRIAGALAEPVDGAFDLARAADDAGERIGDREAKIVVAMHREDRLVDVRHAVEPPRNMRARIPSGSA